MSEGVRGVWVFDVRDNNNRVDVRVSTRVVGNKRFFKDL